GLLLALLSFVQSRKARARMRSRFACWLALSTTLLMGCSSSSSDGANGASDGAAPGASDASSGSDAKPECVKSADCSSGVCKLPEGVCQAPTATDGVKNGDETDTDCGGTHAPACAPGAKCVVASDCASGVCIDGSTIDAGADGGTAGDAGAGLRCQAPSPTDGVKNGTETDTDCGGDAAPACADGDVCLVAADCKSSVCKTNGSALVCQAPTPSDGVKNGNETDVDCGGPDAVPCPDNSSCVQGSDCTSLVCDDTGAGPKCQVPSDADGAQNGVETDIDCGGAGNKKCATNQKCAVHADCASDGCGYGGRCVEARSCAVRNGGDTCGASAAAGESCCKTLPVGNDFVDAKHPGKRVYLDKYEITAGRMRAFIQRMTELYGVPNVRAWLLANKPAVLWNDDRNADDSFKEDTNWTRWLPGAASETISLPRYNTYLAPGGTPVANPTGNIGTDFIFHEEGWYFYQHAHNLGKDTGFPTYGYPRDAREIAQAELDQKAMNAVPNAMLAAFCVWDGGQLATISVLAKVSGVAYTGSAGGYGAIGRMPALTHNAKAPCTGSEATCAPSLNQGAANSTYGCPLVNYSNEDQIHWYPKVPYWSPFVDGDNAPRIAPPGRMTTDATPALVAGNDPWMDLRGNLNEIAIDDRTNQTVLRFSAIHYDGIGRNSARAGSGSAHAVFPEYKTGMVGGRCMRFRDQ
ncbi:MAG: Tryptophan synthase alpha chain, partial [Labilithrix sp.]|nr:Tryptophan synthase alpha chain [Labilithrix sp.]